MSYKIETRKVIQNNQGFLLGIFKMENLRKFVKYTERIVIEYENNKPKYNEEVQRKLSPGKVDGIADFLIYDSDAFFPTNIVLSIPTAAIEQLDESGETTNVYIKDEVLIENRKDNGLIFITIIDGQHRIAGIEKAIKRISDKIRNLENSIRTSIDTEKHENELRENHLLLRRLLDFEIIATFFIDSRLEYQAMIFSTINRTQTKVSENLVYSLFGLSTADSPQKTSLEIVLALNASETSPFFNRMKLVGASYIRNSIPPLSQATMVKSILYLITPNLKQAEIEKNKTREQLKIIKFPNSFLPFRKFYAYDQDEKIIQIINNYFKAVRDTFVDTDSFSYWNLSNSFNLLQTTVGYRALLMILEEILLKNNEEDWFDYDFYIIKLKPAKDIDFKDEQDPKRFPLTSKSVNLLYNAIGSKVFGQSFVPKEIKG